MMSNLSGSYPGQRTGDLTSCEVTLLNQLNERRDSTTSTISSAYTMSRRSSGISPCYSSRRSSEASQFGANRHNNISSADSYDPISTDLSRRSSEASQCGGSGGVSGGGGGGLPSLLSLTPAQHYRLKAKYAAATGGAPPTPLPNMDRMSLRTRMALYSDSQESSSHPFHQPPPGTVPRRCSDIGYGTRSMMPHEVPNNLPRRASDPVRRPTLDPLSFPRVQRYNSMNSMNPMNGQPAERHQAMAMQGYTRSDGSLQRYPFAPRPPSISENVVMENMAVDGMMAGGEQNGEDDMVLPDDVVQYLRSQNPGPSGQNSGQVDYHSNHQTQGFQAGMAPPPSFYTQRRMAMVDATMTQSGQDMQPCQQSFSASSQNMNKNNMPVQWNEVSSGTVDATNKLSKPQQHPLRGNLAVVQQRHNFGSYQVPGQNLPSNQQVVPMSQNMSMQGYVNHNSQRPMNISHQHQQQRQCNNVNFGEHMSPQQGFGQEAIPNSMSGSTSMRPPQNSIANPEIQNYRARTQVDGYSHMNQVDLQQSYGILTQQQHNVHNGGRATLQPRPPTEPKSNSRQHSGSNIMQQTRMPKSLDISPCHGTNTSEASPKRPSGAAAHNNSENLNSAVLYTGQIHMFEQSSSVSFDAPMSPCTSQAPASNPTAAANMASPGVNLVSSSTVDSSTGGSGGTEHVQIDFDTMLDDGDHSSLMSGTLSPGLLQSLSQNSSRLTTPRNSVTLTSVPAGIGNMAIGDMNSMLTALAEESKFLNMIS